VSPPAFAHWISGGLPSVALRAPLLLIKWDQKLKASRPAFAHWIGGGLPSTALRTPLLLIKWD
jgi:hypothetical protein